MSEYWDATAIYERAVKYCSGHHCGSYAYCYKVLKLAHNKIPEHRREAIVNELKARQHLSKDQAIELLKELANFRLPDPELIHNRFS